MPKVSSQVTNLITGSLVFETCLHVEHIELPPDVRIGVFVTPIDQDAENTRQAYRVDLYFLEKGQPAPDKMYKLGAALNIGMLPTFYISSDILRVHGEEEGISNAIATYLELNAKAYLYEPGYYSENSVTLSQLESGAPTLNQENYAFKDTFVLLLVCGRYKSEVMIPAEEFFLWED